MPFFKNESERHDADSACSPILSVGSQRKTVSQYARDAGVRLPCTSTLCDLGVADITCLWIICRLRDWCSELFKRTIVILRWYHL